MDLRSMLNDSAAQRPPSLHTPHSSYDARAAGNTPVAPQSHSRSQSHTQSSRPTHYPPPLQPVDSRSPSSGGYFPTQSPHPTYLNSASTHPSTPSAGPPSAYARSPVSQPQSYTPREGPGPPGAYGASFVPSPSLSVNQPPTPNSAYQHHGQTPLSAHSAHPPPFAHAQSPRGSNPPNGQTRQISPHTPQSYPQPVTPLGPPTIYSKISPQVQRPPSQGLEQHYRKSSHGSVGSVHGREFSIPLQQAHESGRPESLQRQSIPDIERVKERERSVSVSPKTIPQPSPYRQTSISSQPGSQGRPSIHSPPEVRAMSHISDTHTNAVSVNDIKSEYQSDSTPRASMVAPEHTPLSRGPSVQQDYPEATSSPARPPNLKRNASFMSDQSHTSQLQPRKRLKRDDVPVFARSARQKRLRLGTGEHKEPLNKPTSRPVAQPSQQQPIRSGPQATVNGKVSTPMPTVPKAADVKWESSIANIAPYEDLTRCVCDWIFSQIGTAVPPSGGAMFEIEAKIGEIFDTESGERVRLPVETESVFNKEKWPHRTKFESSMNMEQHMLLNKYLNEITQEAFVQAQKGERLEILYDHPQEVDEFFELTAEGKQNLNPSILTYLHPHHKPKVRRTRDKNTGQTKAQIIKSRIADLEIYNPRTDFDCRVSISIESAWEGNPNWLVPMRDGHDGRHKDRMSYRHMAYQVDLTQVSHDGQASMAHELEVEISTEQIRREIDNLQNGRPNKYEDLVRGLIDNVRLLCRKGTVGGPKRG